METKHTKGEWLTGPCSEGVEIFVRGTAIARCPKSFSDEEFNKEVEANAKLIASAPLLLEALIMSNKLLLSIQGESFKDWPEFKSIQSAINKATL